MTRSDEEIIQAVLNGDRHEYAELVRRYEKTVHAVAFQILEDFHSAEDITQDAFVTAYEKLVTLRNRSVFGAWIVKIARRQAIRWSRRNPKPHALDESMETTQGRLNGQLTDEAKQLLKCVSRLPKHERRAVMMKHFDGHTAASIARITGHPVGTITKRLSRAYTRLRKWLERI